jgi:uncharacterized membrane protein YfcA
VLYAVPIAIVALIAGAIAAVAGFGIGSLLTPALAVSIGTKLAVAAVAIPHFIGTVQRFWILRRHIDQRVLRSFGIASVLGGLSGALLHTQVSSRALSVVFGALLILAAISEFTGWIEKVHWGRRAGWIAGALSGLLGGLVGNQGGIRSAAMLGFDVPKESFVATATAAALFVDGARLPVYLATQWRDIVVIWPIVLLMTAAVMAGTVFGARVLGHLPQKVFRRVVAVILFILGCYMTAAGGLQE